MKNVSYIVGALPAWKIAVLAYGKPAIGSILIGLAAFAAWVMFIRWTER